MDENIKKEIIALKSQGYTETQIKQTLTKKGCMLQDVNEAISEAVNDSQKPNKTKRLTVILSIILVILMILVVYVLFKTFVLDNDKLSDNPEDWIEKGKNNNITINVTEATKYMSNYDLSRQTYIDTDGEIYSLFMTGYYKGENLKWIYEETGKLPMLPNENMNTNDGIPEAFSVLRKENETFVIYVFLDEDWKNEFGDETYLLWTTDVLNDSSYQEKQFDFTNGKNGVYFNKIENAEWIRENPVKGRAYVGDLRVEDVKNNNYMKTVFEIS